MNSTNFDFYRQKIDLLNCCVIIPTYNNEKTIISVIKGVLAFTANIIVVNDGSTDTTSELIKSYNEKINVIEYFPNKGKGIALRTGIKKAQDLGYKYAITIDSDGQHFADDIIAFIDEIEKNPDTLLVGARNLNQENMPKKNTFGNKFSNFWFKLFTHIDLPDTQSGYRLYPIQKMKGTKYFTSKYEFEIEVMVKAAWKGINVKPVPIKVFYAEGSERVTHFRPFKDFTRISLLNTYLFFVAFLWHKPIFLIKNLSIKNIKLFLKKHFIDTNESVLKKSVAVSFGVFMGIIPIWGYQFVSALLLAHVFKLNKAIVGLAAQISVPPMIPFLIYGSLKTGQFALGGDLSESIFDSGINTISEIWAAMKLHLLEYLIGSFIFAIIMAIFLGLISYIILKISLKKNTEI